jgi:predicted DNA-binding transcriptional regulator AlpA
MTLAEAALRTGYSRQTIYHLISSKKLVRGVHYFKPTPKKVLFRWDVLKAWIERIGPDAPPEKKGPVSKIRG